MTFRRGVIFSVTVGLTLGVVVTWAAARYGELTGW